MRALSIILTMLWAVGLSCGCFSKHLFMICITQIKLYDMSGNEFTLAKRFSLIKI